MYNLLGRIEKVIDSFIKKLKKLVLKKPAERLFNLVIESNNLYSKAFSQKNIKRNYNKYLLPSLKEWAKIGISKREVNTSDLNLPHLPYNDRKSNLIRDYICVLLKEDGFKVSRANEYPLTEEEQFDNDLACEGIRDDSQFVCIVSWDLR